MINNSNVIITKKPTIEQLKEARDIIKESYPSLYDRIMFRINFTGSLYLSRFYFNKYFFLYYNKQMIGFTITRWLWIRLLFIHPAFKHKGFGSMLLNIIEKDYKKRNYETIFVQPKKSALSFYIKHNYHPFLFFNRLYASKNLIPIY